MTDVVDAPERNRFEFVDGDHVAELVYRLDGDRLTLVHTGVPDELGGQGLGGRLVRAALERAKADHLTLVPECPFAKKWLQDHPTDVGDVPIDWPTA